LAPPPPRPAEASPLLRAGPPARPATVLTALRFSRLAGSLSPSTTRTAVSGHAFPRSAQKQQTGLTSPTCRTPPGQSAVTRQAHPGLTYYTPVLMPSTELRHVNSDPRKRGDCAPSFRSPPDASRAPFPHRSPRRSSANAACGGLKPPTAGRLRRAKPSSPAQHHLKKLYLQTELLSTFVAHVDSHRRRHLRLH
jgi:hypothetical protein